MSNTDAQTVLRRKLAPPRPSKAPGQGALQQMLAKIMPRDADKLLGLQVAVAGVEPGEAEKDDVIRGLQPADLIYLMKSETGSPGICTVSPGLLSGLIELQMSGKVSASDATGRIPTRTDGIVASDIVDQWIASAKAEAKAQDILDRLPFRNHFRARPIANARNADLALDPGRFHTLVITLDMSGGVKTGTLSFAMPLRQQPRSALPGGTAEMFRSVIQEAEAQLSVVLARLPQRLERVRRLEVGDVLEIPIQSLASVTLETSGGDVVATARLGQSGGQKAVRIPGVSNAEVIEAPRRPTAEFLGAAVAAGKPSDGSAAFAEIPGAVPDMPELPGLADLPALPEKVAASGPLD